MFAYGAVWTISRENYRFPERDADGIHGMQVEQIWGDFEKFLMSTTMYEEIHRVR